MAQSLETHTSANSRVIVATKSLAIPVTNSLTTLLEILTLNGIKRLWAAFYPTVHDFNAFQIQGRFHADETTYRTIYSTSGQYTSPAGILVATGADMTALAAAATTGWLALDVAGLVGLRFQASSASASGTLVDAYANGSS